MPARQRKAPPPASPGKLAPVERRQRPRQGHELRQQPRMRPAPRRTRASELHLVIITGLSGSGKGSVVKAFEDSGYYCVDNLPVGLLPHLVRLVRQTEEIQRLAAVVDIREGHRLKELPAYLEKLRSEGQASGVRLTLLFLEANDEVLMQRFSETRRPHPLAQRPGGRETGGARRGIQAERRALARSRAAADLVVDTSKFNVHELRAFVQAQVIQSGLAPHLQVAITSFGFRHGLPSDADLVFDVRFLPNPNYIPELRLQTGHDRKVADYIRAFPQTGEFLQRIGGLLAYLIPHYQKEGKSYLNIAIGCTGGHHRSVYIAEALQRELRRQGIPAALAHRDWRR